MATAVAAGDGGPPAPSAPDAVARLGRWVAVATAMALVLGGLAGWHLVGHSRGGADGVGLAVVIAVAAFANAGAALALVRETRRAMRREWAAGDRRFRDAIEAMPDGVLIIDADRAVGAWNRRLIELMPHLGPVLRVGVTTRELAVRAVNAAHPDWSAEERARWIENREASLDSVDYRAELPLMDGRLVELTHRHGSGGGIVMVYRDITAERRAVASLATSEARFRDAIAALGEGFALWDAENRLVAWNRRFLELSKIPAPIVTAGMTFEAALRDVAPRRAGCRPGESHEDWIAARLAHRRTGRRMEIALADGTVVEAADHRHSGGGIVSIYRDITDERRVLNLLRQSEARFRDGIQSMADGFVMMDADDRVVTWNERLLELLPNLAGSLRVGGTRRDIVVAAAEASLPHLSAAERAEWVAGHLATRGRFDQAAVLGLDDGRTVEVVERRTSEGGCVAIYRDVTERERQERELRRALAAERAMNQQQRRFIAVASHEFRTPIAIIDGAAQRILARLADGEPEIVKRLRRIRSAVSRMTQLIDLTLASARHDEGQIEPRPEVFDLAALLRELCERQQSISPEFAITVVAPDTASVFADPRLIEQVLTNLLSNAVKYSGTSRQVEATLATSAAGARIAIRDHGLGIGPEDMPRLFERFFRARTATGLPGTGIGLHLARDLVAMHGGTIAVESAPGVGSCFTVDLPYAAAPRPIAAAPAS